MVLYGLDGMTHRSQAYGLLAVGLREHWDLEQLYWDCRFCWK